MHFQQVCMTALAFSAARGGTMQSCPGGVNQLAILPLRGGSEIVVEQDNQDADSWYVSLTGQKPALRPDSPGPLYLRPVNTQEALMEALSTAWEFHRQTLPPIPFLTRFIEPETPPFSP